MATTWTASAPHATAIKETAAAFGTSYGASGSSVFVGWSVGSKRFRLTQLTADGAGTYTTGGDATPLPAVFGLREIFAAYIVASPTTGVVPAIDGATGSGTPAILTTTSTAPKVQYFDNGTESSAAYSTASDTFHVILVGI